MSTLSEITFGVINTINPKSISGSPITKELVAFHLKNARAVIAKQQVGKYGTLDSSYIQSLGCIDLVQADKSECCEYPTGCVILRTAVKIPQTLSGSTNLLTRVGPVNLTEPAFQHVEFERVPFLGFNKYTKNTVKWFTPNFNNYVYLVVPEGDFLENSIEVIGINGAFEDPEMVSAFMNCSTGDSCFNADSQYPIPDSVIPIIQDMVIKNFVGIQFKQPIDSSNDNSNNPENTLNK